MHEDLVVRKEGSPSNKGSFAPSCDAVQVVPSVYQPSGEPAKFSGQVVTPESLNWSHTLSVLLVILMTSPSQHFSVVLISLSTYTNIAGVWSASLSGFITAPRSIWNGYDETLPTLSQWFDLLVIKTYLKARGSSRSAGR